MPIQFSSDHRLFLLETANTAYVFSLTDGGRLLHLYWGARLPYPSDYPTPPEDSRMSSFNSSRHELRDEFPVRGGIQEVDPCLRVLFADGTRDARLKYASHTISEDNNGLVVHLKDEFYPLEVFLEYRVYPDCDILTRRVEVVNTGEAPVTLEEILSGSVFLPPDQGDYRLTSFSGAWAMEMQLDRTPVTPGRKVLEGRLNYTGHSAQPFFALDSQVGGQGATETEGEVWFGALVWSGNWKIAVGQTRSPLRLTRVAAGLNDYDFSWNLGPGEKFETPVFTLGFSGQGFGQMSRNLHRYQMEHVMLRPYEPRPVLYNSWEAVGFNPNEAEQLALAEKAARLGIEIFVVDDGWFGARDNDTAGLGDWQPNPRKFPNGLNPLIEKVNSLGMGFGLWVEPEMVNPDSDLYRAHPDWVYRFPNREPITGRNQLILNLSRQEVQDWIFGWMDELLSAHNISYIKWDYNRAMSDPGWPEASPEHHREIWVRHVQALYDVVDRLRERHPQVWFEACSGGGGRVDMGILHHFHHTYGSDDTDPLDRLAIQQGFTVIHPPEAMYCWVSHTDWNNANFSLRYRFHSGFMGSMCVVTDLNRWTEAETAEATRMVAEYKEIRPIIQHGSFYRLTPPGDETLMGFQYLSRDEQEGVVLAFSHAAHFWRSRRSLRLQNLAPDALYELSGDLGPGAPVRLSGQALMQRGVSPHLDGLVASALIRFRRVSGG